MKEKIKVGDIIKYNGTDFFGDDIQIIGYIIGTSISNNKLMEVSKLWKENLK